MREDHTTLPQINKLREVMKKAIEPSVIDPFDMPPPARETPKKEGLAHNQTKLYEKMAMLRAKYAVISGDLEEDIVQIIIEEIGQGLKPK